MCERSLLGFARALLSNIRCYGKQGATAIQAVFPTLVTARRDPLLNDGLNMASERPVYVVAFNRGMGMLSFLPAKILTVVLGCLMVPVLSGCAITGTYPGDWPEPGKVTVVGKCPSIAGKYSNSGISHPSDARPLSLTQLLDLADGDQVEITQSPDVIAVSVWNAGERSETVTFSSGEKAYGWDTSQPRTFICPVDILSGRILLFSHLHKQSLALGYAGVGWEAVRFNKANDGSLIVWVEKGGGVLLAVVPVGWLDRVWYLFQPSD
jgi:hypothetical protein